MLSQREPPVDEPTRARITRLGCGDTSAVSVLPRRPDTTFVVVRDPREERRIGAAAERYDDAFAVHQHLAQRVEPRRIVHVRAMSSSMLVTMPV